MKDQLNLSPDEEGSRTAGRFAVDASRAILLACNYFGRTPGSRYNGAAETQRIEREIGIIVARVIGNRSMVSFDDFRLILASSMERATELLNHSQSLVAEQT